ncbi:hypothetical protein [Peribacillus frigoritolerans]|uniref:hypothetical protein n=1 Tax=Peribacillus frigoritolerans TaxID=450367 RepID=UPI0032E48721
MAINLPYGITIPMVIVLDYDTMTGYAMVCFGAMAGFLTRITNPCNVGVAQGIANVKCKGTICTNGQIFLYFIHMAENIKHRTNIQYDKKVLYVIPSLKKRGRSQILK